jgi:hypothetical protein
VQHVCGHDLRCHQARDRLAAFLFLVGRLAKLRVAFELLVLDRDLLIELLVRLAQVTNVATQRRVDSDEHDGSRTRERSGTDDDVPRAGLACSGLLGATLGK